MKTINNFVNEKLTLNKSSKINQTKSNDGWADVQNEQGKNWYYNTFAPNPLYKHGVIHINSDYEAISLMVFDNYEQMCNDMGTEFDANLDKLQKFESIDTNSGRYIKLW